MALQKFGLAAAGEMDGGKIGVAFEHALARCRADCEDRPTVKDVRKITFSVTMRPLAGDNGDLESVDVDMDVGDNLPKRKTQTYNMRSARGGLFFNELSPDEVRQMTIDEAPSPSATESTEEEDQEVSDVG